ncbi:hypothetical protein EIG75_05515 [Pseudomonas syringae]|uniref:hypothetical protein n=1 Tax=Pseudomonas syringae TaxID=317 RepID=UPI0006248526|nr:hypothetical protein [Pseudomonas syringae]AKF53923.1 hypothetical protein PsyrH_26165 [Pseudomonas syringae pv. syringae HS191]RML67790.1 hypothetical protein ALQ91_03113 [Pseudomonas syringae pv. syringae]MDC6531554.1 hypothetical protein [Pseudomonas syringae]MDC6590577.1 hypothetical protein [Pseudomonas syringae]RRD20089.1 hypothetical protein EIG75_05515 [Pseudomonas syringae]
MLIPEGDDCAEKMHFQSGFTSAKVVTHHIAANETLAAIAKSKHLEVSEDPMLMDEGKALILEIHCTA